jgi:hypothetical protein
METVRPRESEVVVVVVRAWRHESRCGEEDP